MKAFTIIAISSVLLSGISANAHPRDWNGHRSGTSASQSNDVVRMPRTPYSAQAHEPYYGGRDTSVGFGAGPAPRVRSQFDRDRVSN